MAIHATADPPARSELGYRVTDQGSGIGAVLLAQRDQPGVADQRAGNDLGGRLLAGLGRKMTEPTSSPVLTG
jgi:hypothetical protein